jgi:hypothetical protein
MKRRSSIKVSKFIRCSVFLILLITACNSKYRFTTSDGYLLHVNFGDFFSGNKVSASLNEQLVLENVNLESDHSLGITKVGFKLIKERSGYFVLVGGSKIKLDEIDRYVKLNLRVDNIESVFRIDLTKGKYILIDNSKSKKLRLNQYAKPPILD